MRIGIQRYFVPNPNEPGLEWTNCRFTAMVTGVYEGKGQNKTFTSQTAFTAGNTVVDRAQVLDANGQPVSNATMEVTIGGPESVTLNSGPSRADCWAEVTWQTQNPNKKGQGGTPAGTFSAATTNATVSGYNWDSVTTSITFTIQ